MKTKRLAILISVLAVIVVIVVLSSTVFTLKQVEVQFYTKNDTLITNIDSLNYFNDSTVLNIENNKQDFSMGQSIFLTKKSNITAKLEKDYPYLKVIALTTMFPDKIIVKAAEREEFYAVPVYTGSSITGYAICDGDLKVLRMGTSADAANLITLDGGDEDSFKLGSGDASIGEILNVGSGDLTIAKQLYNDFQSCFALLPIAVRDDAMLSTFESMTFTQEYSTQPYVAGQQRQIYTYLTVKTRSGVSIRVEDAGTNLLTKLNVGYSIYNDILNGDCTNKNAKADEGFIKVAYNLTYVWTAEY